MTILRDRIKFRDHLALILLSPFLSNIMAARMRLICLFCSQKILWLESTSVILLALHLATHQYAHVHFLKRNNTVQISHDINISLFHIAFNFTWKICSLLLYHLLVLTLSCPDEKAERERDSSYSPEFIDFAFRRYSRYSLTFSSLKFHSVGYPTHFLSFPFNDYGKRIQIFVLSLSFFNREPTTRKEWQVLVVVCSFCVRLERVLQIAKRIRFYWSSFELFCRSLASSLQMSFLCFLCVVPVLLLFLFRTSIDKFVIHKLWEEIHHRMFCSSHIFIVDATQTPVLLH